MMVLLLWLLMGQAWASTVTLEAWVSNPPDSGVGSLVVQMEIPAGIDVQWPKLEVKGLRFTESGDPQTETFGSTSVVRRSFRFSGQPGHYEIPPLTVEWKDGEETHSVATKSIFVDVKKDPVREGSLTDIAEPSVVWVVPAWIKWASGALLLGVMALVGGSVLIRRMGRTEEVVIPDPPDVVAIRAWERVHADETIGDYDKSVEISRIFRDYAEAALGFAATAWTTLEILEKLSSMPHLKSGNIPRAKRLLRATDRIKFADAAAAKELFDDLDADLRGFVGSTRPTKWGETE